MDNIELRCHNQYESELFYGAHENADGSSLLKESASTCDGDSFRIELPTLVTARWPIYGSP